MLDNIHDRDGQGESPREPGGRSADGGGPLSDREVPLGPFATAEVIHRWLDGEVPEPAVVQGDSARAVEFWRRVSEETERRKRVVTPPHVASRIMAAISETPAATVSITPWWQEDTHLSRVTAIVLAAAAFVLGLLVMGLLAG